MAQRPSLPTETQAAISNAREQIITSRRYMYDLLFDPPPLSPEGVTINMESAPSAVAPSGVTLIPARRKPETLKFQLRHYSSAIFDAEAQYYSRHSQGEPELHSWLNNLASCIEYETIRETEIHSAIHNHHCPISERIKTINDVLQQRVDHWLKMARSTATTQLQLSHLPIITDRKEPSLPLANARKVAGQIDDLRRECHLTVEQLATKIGVEARSVYRHLSGTTQPRIGHIGAYERVFSELLERKIVISITSAKRQ
jgi:DNA-binding XRE family transcriptional regulator